MEKTISQVEELARSIKSYINNRLAALKLGFAETVSRVVADTMGRLIGIMVIFFFLLFSGVALSILAGEWTGRLWLGFLITACFYLLLGIIVWTFRNRLIRRPVMNKLLQQLFGEDEED